MEKELEEHYKFLIDFGFKNVSLNADLDSNDLRLSPIALGIGDKGQSCMISLPWNDEESKIEMLKTLGEKCFKDSILKIGLITDIAMKEYRYKPDMDTEAPLTYPVNMRIDGLLLAHIDFMDAHQNTLIIYPYTVTEGKLNRKEEMTFKRSEAESIGGSILKNISFGFLNAAILAEKEKKGLSLAQLYNEGKTLLKNILKKYPGAVLGNESIQNSQRAV